MTMTGANRSTRREIATSAMSCTINPIRTGPGLHRGLGSEKMVTRSETFQKAAKEGSRDYDLNF
jgi:hypothetical protein